MRELLQIGEIARLVGVSTKTIRYYHEIGLLDEPVRAESGYRLYTARQLLRLQRIRRLRALGLSLERIRAILSDVSEDGASTLRAALQSLVEELCAQILELEERRSLLQTLLAGEKLEPVEEGTHFLYSPAIKAQLTSLFAEQSSAALAWGESIDALLGSFHWPAEYRQTFQEAIQHIANQAEQFHHLFDLEMRIAGLANLPADASEVAQLAEEYLSSPDLPRLFAQLAQGGSLAPNPYVSMLVELLATAVSPAQRRFFELLAQKGAAGHTALTTGHRPEEE
ncbi:MAG TPA: MerR family transcriptional regulator [Ktedonobacteraceae bacterium]